MGSFDVAVVGGGAAGLMAAIAGAERGARVIIIEAADVLGGSLWVATGQMSAAGTRLQRQAGIDDTPDAHFDDLLRISRGTINRGLARLAVDNAAVTFDWLMDRGFAPLPEHPVKGFGHEPYRENRYYWGEKGGISVKDVLVPIVEDLAAGGALDLYLGHEAVGLETDDDGAVVGVTCRSTTGDERRLSADAVVLATGGYAADPDTFAALSGYPLYNAAPYPFARGAGLRMGEQVGGYLRGHENVFNNFGTLYDSDNFPTRSLGVIETFPERREPWEIYVNADGHRFVREDIRSVDAREMALSEQSDRRYWIIFDQAIFDAAPPMIVGWSRERMAEAFTADRSAFFTADTLPALAEAAGVAADGLVRAVAGFNYGVQTGNDFFGRTHAPLPIATVPLYAIRMQGSSISSAVGLAVDDELRVVRRDGSIVGNLYAAGELLGSSQTMGKAACGGMMVTPALTFGRLLGERLAAKVAA